MSYWVEVHCDVNEPGCIQHLGDYPMRHVTSRGGQATLRGLRELEAEAVEKGWVRLHAGQWACPSCGLLVHESRHARQVRAPRPVKASAELTQALAALGVKPKETT